LKKREKRGKEKFGGLVEIIESPGGKTPMKNDKKTEKSKKKKRSTEMIGNTEGGSENRP